MFLFESQIHSLLAAGAGVAIGLPLYSLTVYATRRGLAKLFPRMA